MTILLPCPVYDTVLYAYSFQNLFSKEIKCSYNVNIGDNDIIYDPTSGYRQDRIKVIGYRVDGWNGSLSIPGFVFDEAKGESSGLFCNLEKVRS